MARGFSLAGILDAASAAVESLGRSPEGMPHRIWQEVGPWMLGVTRSAAAKWLPVLSRGEPCRVRNIQAGRASPCTNHAISPCVACSQPACIHHACIDQHGDVICYACVAEQMLRKKGGAAGPAPGDREPPVALLDQKRRVAAALKVLGLKATATEEEAHSKHRKLSARHHPDKFQSDEDKAKNEAKYKAVQVAYADLQRFHFRKGQAAA